MNEHEMRHLAHIEARRRYEQQSQRSMLGLLHGREYVETLRWDELPGAECDLRANAVLREWAKGPDPTTVLVVDGPFEVICLPCSGAAPEPVDVTSNGAQWAFIYDGRTLSPDTTPCGLLDRVMVEGWRRQEDS